MGLKSSIPSFDFIAFDLETTGLDAMRDEIIEIAAVRFAQGEVAERFQCFVRPVRPVPTFIKQLTGITDAQLADGVPVAEALARLDEFLGEAIIVGHNVGFDLGFHEEARSRLHLTPRAYRYLDTLTLSRIYQPFLDSHKLESVAQSHGLTIERAHRAIDDAEATGHVLLKLLELMHTMPLATNARLQELARLATDGSELAWLLEQTTDHQRKHALMTKQPQAKEFAPANAIEHDMPGGRFYALEDVFGEGGLFAQVFEGYEHRPGQVQMASAVEQAQHNGECLLVEAGTGVGKSLAYLVPAIQFAERNHTRVVVSTNTKNLQEQLFHKDLPAIRSAVDVPFRAVLLKGRENYLCPRKWHETTVTMRNVSPWEAGGLLDLMVWAEQTQTGDVSENSSFSRKRYGGLWKRLAADRHFCQGKRCSHYKQCWLMDVRQRSEDAHIIIVNHSLLLADVMGGNTTLGDYEHLVIDEAHNLPDAASNHLGVSLSWADVSAFFGQLSSARARWQGGTIPLFKAAVVKCGLPEQKKDALQKAAEAIEALLQQREEEVRQLFVEAGSVCAHAGSYGKLRLRDMSEHAFLVPALQSFETIFAELERRLGNLRESLANTSAQLFGEQDAHLSRLDAARQRCGEFREALEPFLSTDYDDHAYWFSSFHAEPNAPNGMLHAAPLNIDDILHEHLYEGLRSLVCTSATLALRGVFKYFSHRVGLDRQENRRELVVPSPFDYAQQCKVLVAGFLPDPKDEKFYAPQALSVLRDLVSQTRVGSMVLFTSHRDLQHAADTLMQPFYEQDILLLAQTHGTSRTSLLNQFRKHGQAVLLGTSSFWEGVDVRGEALSLLALYKLPFQVPSEPIVEAHIERLKRQGHNPFQHYQLPTALLRFRQGIGRLIRSRSDRGVILILDRRVLTKSYGKYFGAISPTPWRATQEPVELLDIVTRFFRSV